MLDLDDADVPRVAEEAAGWFSANVQNLTGNLLSTVAGAALGALFGAGGSETMEVIQDINH